MKSNYLYQFLLHFKNQELDTNKLKSNNLIFKQSVEGQNYGLYKLDTDTSFELQTEKDVFSTLISHHVSFYEEYNNSVTLSQYHWTGYFQDDDYNFYQIHLYFNENDKLISEPKLYKRDKDNELILCVVNPNYLTPIKSFVNIITQPFIKGLRQQLASYILISKAVCDRELKELDTLSMDLPTNNRLYLQKIDSILIKLQTILLFSSDHKYASTFNILSHVKHSALAKIKTAQVSKMTEEKEEVVADVLFDVYHSDLKLLKYKADSNVPNTAKIKNDLLTDLLDRALIAQQNYQKLNLSLSLDQRINILLEYIQQVQELLGLSLETPNPSSISQEISSLLIKSNLAAESMLGYLLTENKFDLADSLKSFIQPVAAKFVKIALFDNNHLLLAYVLQHATVPINTFIVAEGLTPAAYCYTKHTKENSKLECFSVLVAHKVDLMIKAKDNLPIAHHLTANMSHPLRKALSNNYELTLGNVSFYRQLINAINHLKQDPHSDAKKLSLILKTYTASYKLLSENGCAALTKQLETSEIITTKLRQYFSELSRELLLNDPKVKAIKQKYDNLYKTYLARLSKRELMTANREGNQYLEKLDLLMQGVDPNEYDLPELVIITYSGYVEILTLKIELSEIQDIIKKPVFAIQKNKVREQHALLIRQNELIKEINILQQQHFCSNYSIQDIKDLKAEENDLNLVKTMALVKKSIADLSSFFSGARGKEEDNDDESQKLNLFNTKP